MSENNLVKAVMDVATCTGLTAGISWISNKVVKKFFNADPIMKIMQVDPSAVHKKHVQRNGQSKNNYSSWVPGNSETKLLWRDSTTHLPSTCLDNSIP